MLYNEQLFSILDNQDSRYIHHEYTSIVLTMLY